MWADLIRSATSSTTILAPPKKPKNDKSLGGIDDITVHDITVDYITDDITDDHMGYSCW